MWAWMQLFTRDAAMGDDRGQEESRLVGPSQAVADVPGARQVCGPTGHACEARGWQLGVGATQDRRASSPSPGGAIARRRPDSIRLIKLKVRARDGYACTACGMTELAHLDLVGRTLEVHRVVPGSAYSLAGCVTLCRQCHANEPKSPVGRHRPGFRVSVKLAVRPDIKAALESCARESGVCVRIVVEAALRHFLREKGFWPWPPESPADKAAPRKRGEKAGAA